MGLVAWFPLASNVTNKGSDSSYAITISGATYAFYGKVAYHQLKLSNKQMFFNNPFAGCDEWTLAFWYEAHTPAIWSDIFTFSNSYGRIEFSADNGGRLHWYQNDATYGDLLTSGTELASGLSDNTWYHITLTYKNGTTTFYLDGVEKVKQTGKSNYNIYCEKIYFGSRIGGSYANIGLSDIRCYDYALSAKEVKNLKKCLLLHYNFENLYKPLDFIETTGTQYIRTGIIGPAIWEYDIQYTNTTARQLMGHGGNGGEYWGTTDGVYGMASWSKGSIAVGNRDIFRVENISSGRKIYVNGVYSHSEGYDTRCESNEAQLFGIGGSNHLNYCKLWGCKVWQNNVLVRDFIPCLRNFDGKVGLYDKINGTFYVNAGIGEFFYEGCFSPVNPNNASISKNTVTFSKSSDGWGNSGITGKSSFKKGFVSATIGQTTSYIMIGLAPTNTSFNYTQGYFVYPRADGTVDIYELGTMVANYGAYNANDRFEVIYDGYNLRYYKNGTLLRERTVGQTIGAGTSLYMNITNYSASSGSVKDVCYGSLDMIEDLSGLGYYARLQNSSAFSLTPDTKVGEVALRNVSGDSNARINTTLRPDIIFSGTICFWYKKDNSAFNYNSGHFLAATQHSSGNYFGATQNGQPFCSDDCSYGTFYLDGVAGANSTVNDTNWHFYAYTGVNVSAWDTFSMHAHGDNSWLYRGNIADFKVYNTSLSATEIKELYETRMIIDNDGNIYCEKLVKNKSNCEFPNEKGVVKASDFMTNNVATIDCEYDLLEYIESTGTQYIDTGVKQTNKGCVDCKFHNVTTSSNYWFGSRQDSASMLYNGFYNNAALEYNWATISYTASSFVEMKQKLEGNDIIISINGVQTQVATGSADNNNIFIFACNNASVRYYAGKLRLYYFKMYDYGKLVRDYIPVRRKSDGVLGLLDKVNDVFYTNKGSGTFNAGPNLGTCYLVGGANIYEGMGAGGHPLVSKKVNKQTWHTIFEGNRKISFTQYDNANLAIQSPVEFVSLNYPTRISVSIDWDYNSVGNTDSTDSYSGIIPTQAFVAQYWSPASIQFTALKKYGVNGQYVSHFDCKRVGEGTPIWAGSVTFHKIEQFY